MTTEEFRRLENHLVEAEDILAGQRLLPPKALEIRNEIRALLDKVIIERIRSEERNPAEFLSGEHFGDLGKTVQDYRALIEIYRAMCERLRERRKGASDGVMVEIDELLAVKERTIAALNRSIEMTELQIRAEERSAR
jgi:hypothetical protein